MIWSTLKDKLSLDEMLYLQNDGIPDRFIVAGDHYKVIRDVITRVVLGEDIQLMEEELQVGSWWPHAPISSVTYVVIGLFTVESGGDVAMYLSLMLEQCKCISSKVPQSTRVSFHLSPWAVDLCPTS